jgi:hypothetical protein
MQITGKKFLRALNLDHHNDEIQLLKHQAQVPEWTLQLVHRWEEVAGMSGRTVRKK